MNKTTPEPTAPAGVSEMAEELDRAADRLSRSTIAPNPMIRDVIQTLRSGRDALRTPPLLEVAKEALEEIVAGGFNCSPHQFYMVAKDRAERALQAIKGAEQ